MPSKKQYNLVQNDDYDTRIPLHSEEAFQHGITFQAKYIGTVEIPRPMSRVEIVAAMRRIRYEFKAKGTKKKKVIIDVSVDGVKVTLRKKKKKKEWLDGGPAESDGRPILFSHPVYRIFYVSHDSQDLKIFSYIARDASTNRFKCNVFKSNNKNQAMRIVRTVGQAFEVCQKQSADDVAASPEPQDAGTISSLQDDLVDLNDVTSTGDMGSASAALDERLGVNDDFIHDTLDIHSEMATKADLIKEQMRLTTKTTDILRPSGSDTNVTNMTSRDTHSLQTTGETSKQSSGSLPHLGSSLSTHHEVQLLKEQLEQQSQQTQAAIAQIQLLQDQLSAERAARLEAQARTHQLLVHNRELLDHITALVAHLQDCERTQTVAQPQTKPNEVPAHLTCLPQLSSVAKIDRWFETLPTMSLSRPESGFISSTGIEDVFDEQLIDDEEKMLERNRSFISKLSSRKKKKLLGLKLGNATTF